MNPCRSSARALRRNVRHYTELHEGQPPASIRCELYQPPVGPIRRLGRIAAIQYRKQTPKGFEAYWHPFAPHAQPRVGVDQTGRPVIWAGRYRVLTGGITDRSPRSVETEHLPRRPRALSDLGILQWIRYDSGNGERTLRFSARDLLVHDEQGNLHIQTGRPVSDRVEEHMAKAKRNPIRIQNRAGTATNQLMDVATASLAVGLVTLGAMKAGQRFIPARLAGYKRALVQAGAGLGLAGIASRIPQVPSEIVLALGVYGVVAGGETAMDTFQLQRALNATSTPPNPTTNPGAYALGPGGMPTGYFGINRAGCPVYR